MPRAIATLGRERTVATLARRLFEIDTSDREMLTRAERALLRANPRLVDGTGFRRGASVVVPELKGVPFTDEVIRAETSGQGLLDATTLGLQAAASLSEDRFLVAEARRAALEARFEDRAFVQAARRALPEAADAIDKNRARFDTDRESDKETEARLQAGIAAALDAVEKLRALATPDR